MGYDGSATHAIETIRSVPSLSALNRSFCEALAKNAVLRKVTRGENLFCEGKPAEGLFLICSGEVKITRHAHDGREQIFYIARANRPVVEGLRFDEGAYGASAVALRPSTAWLLLNKDIAKQGEQSPALLLAMIDLRAKRADRNVALISDLSLRTVPTRLASFICTQVAMREAQGLDPNSFVRVLTTETVAGRLGTVREEVSRGLAYLEREGALKVSPQVIHITDRQRLETLAYGENKNSDRPT